MTFVSLLEKLTWLRVKLELIMAEIVKANNE